MVKLGKKDVLRIARAKKVKFVRLWFTDILGFLKSFAITIRELEGALEEGMGFDGSSIAGFVRIDESDMMAMPDPSTFRIFPWKANDQVVAVMLCDILEPNGNPHQGDPRWVLKNLKRAADKGTPLRGA
jgi:glutamine synthetase